MKETYEHNLHARQHAIKRLQDQKNKLAVKRLQDQKRRVTDLDTLDYFQTLKTQSSDKPLTPPEDGQCLTPIEWVVGLGLKVIEEDSGSYLSPNSVKDSELLTTSDQVKKLIENFYRNEIEDFGDYIGDINTEIAEKICRWGAVYFSENSSPYEKKCMEIYQRGTVVLSDVGTIISTLPVYEWSSELEETVKDSQWVKIGFIDELFLKLMEHDNESGRLKCRDRNGNFFVFYLKEHQVEIGDCFTLKAKVKEHIESPFDRDMEGNKIRVNNLNYVKVIKNYGKPK